MLWPCDLISYYLEQHSTKSTNCTYLSLLFLMARLFDAPNLIHLFVGNRLSFITSLRRSQPSSLLSSYYLPICWECDLPWLDPVGDLGLFLKPYNCEPMTGSFYSQTQPWLVACMIMRKRFQSTQSLRPLEPLYEW